MDTNQTKSEVLVDRGIDTPGDIRQEQDLRFTSMVQGQDVDNLIAEEREQEILKMNQT